jgi:hypothetical protein
VLAVAIVILGMVGTFLYITFFTALNLTDIFPVFEGKYIVSVNKEKVYKPEFMLYCMLVLQDDNFISANYSNPDIDELVKDKACEMIQQDTYIYDKVKEQKLKLTKDEEKQLLSNVNNTYDENKTDGNGKVYSEREYYEYYFGVSKKEYVDFLRKNQLMTNLVNSEYNNLEISDDVYQQAYDENVDYLNTKLVRSIMLSLTDDDGDPLSDEDTDKIREKAQELSESMKTTDDITTLVSDNSEDNQTKDIGGEIYVQKDYIYVGDFPDGDVSEWTYDSEEVSVWAFDAQINDTGVIEYSGKLFVLKLEQDIGLNELKNTTLMQQYAKAYVYNQDLNNGVESDKYSINKSSAYDDLSVYELVKESISNYTG